MDLEFFIMGGYGHFVWPAFMFTLISCFVFYLKTNKAFKKEEKIFLRNFKQIQEIKIKTTKKQEALSDALIS
tara:strand:+ start:102 stop:317 length:216 start_codon:yes stop_codon:yes gene_type:complete